MSRYVVGDFDADEIFNMFFGGSYGFTRGKALSSPFPLADALESLLTDVYFSPRNHHHRYTNHIHEEEDTV